jgi:hypothetical protein
MPNQPKAGTSRHEITAPGDLVAATRDAAASQGESVSAATRWLWELYISLDSRGVADVKRHLEEIVT